MGVWRPKEIKREMAAIGLAYGAVVLIILLAFVVKEHKGDWFSFDPLASIETPSPYSNPYSFPSAE